MLPVYLDIIRLLICNLMITNVKQKNICSIMAALSLHTLILLHINGAVKLEMSISV